MTAAGNRDIRKSSILRGRRSVAWDVEDAQRVCSGAAQALALDPRGVIAEQRDPAVRAIHGGLGGGRDTFEE